MSFLTKLTSILRGVEEKPKAAPEYKKEVKEKKFLPKKEVFLSKKEVERARTEAREIVLEAKHKAFEIEREADRQARETQQQMFKTQEELRRSETEIERKTGAIEEKEKVIQRMETDIEVKIKEIDFLKRKQISKLEKISNLTRDEAKNLILEATEKKLDGVIARRIKQEEEKAKEQADNKAREILIEAMRLGATDYVPEYTLSTVALPSEDMKGRIIGKEGRNIRTFEKVTGVDVDMDEEGIIRLSSFDSVRREIAWVALKKLIADGRIQPARIEETVEKTRKDLDKIMFQAGEDLCHQLKVYNLPREIVAMLGRFKYRFSYGQNMIAHTLEETKIGVKLAYETKADANIVRLGCLLHDIGKVITEEEGSHVTTAVEFLRRHNIPEPVLACVAEHHEDKPFSSNESVLVYIADAISGSRPGARYEDYEGYIERLKKIEEAAMSFSGVKNAYAIQAGREVRVIVNPEEVKDEGALKIAFDLKEKLEKDLTFPGQVKVTVIREVRATEVAK